MVRKKPAASDRRKYPRAKEEARLLYQEPKGLQVENSVTKNISGGGVCFETEIYVPPATVMEIQINKPIAGLRATLPMRINAKVIWIRQAETGKYKIGLKFIAIKEVHREEIAKNVQEQLKRGLGV